MIECRVLNVLYTVLLRTRTVDAMCMRSCQTDAKASLTVLPARLPSPVPPHPTLNRRMALQGTGLLHRCARHSQYIHSRSKHPSAATAAVGTGLHGPEPRLSLAAPHDGPKAHPLHIRHFPPACSPKTRRLPVGLGHTVDGRGEVDDD